MLTLLLLFFCVSIVFSFLCSLWEAVLLSITHTFAEVEYQKGTSLGVRLRSFKRDVDRPLAAILTLNTIAHTVGAIGVGAQAARIWADSNPLITQLLVPAVMTIAILVLSEIIPKTLGAVHWKRLVPFTVRCLSALMVVLTPLIWLSQMVTRTLKRDAEGSVLSRSDFLAMTRIGQKEGVFEKQETEIIANLLRFERVTVEAVMTPRTVVVMAPEEQTLAEFHADHPELAFSRIPTYQSGSQDLVTGFFLKDELLEQLLAGQGGSALASIRREVAVVSKTLPLPDVFSQLLSNREHIAIAVDEFGGVAGVVTMEDVVETLLGLEIVDETDDAEDMQIQARQQWRRRAQSRGLLVDSSDPEPHD